MEVTTMKQIAYVGGHLLKPSLALPDKGRMVGIDLISEKGKFSFVSYVVLCSQNAADLYRQYQQFYRTAKARWTGKLTVRDMYAFAIRVQLGSLENRAGFGIMFTISNGVSEEEEKAYRLTRKDKKLTIVSATLYTPELDDLLRGQTELTLLV
jgi:hypothetical protein